METILAAAIVEPKRVGILSVLVFLVTGRRILGALTMGLNHVSAVDELDDSLGRRVRVELTLQVGLWTLGLVALAARPMIDGGLGPLDGGAGLESLPVRIIGGGLRVGLLLVIFTLVYAFAPQRERL